MPKYSPTDDRQNDRRQERKLRRLRWWVIPVLLATLIGGPPACLFKKKKAAAPAVVPVGPIRIVFLPANMATEDGEQRWMSLAVPVLMTKLATVSPDLDPVPLWQLLPIAVENAGASRTINPELASYLASRMGAHWAAMGEIAPSKDGLTLLVDFVPVRASAYAFRYQKAVSSSSLESNLRQAVDEFRDYQLAEPAIVKESKAATDAGLLRQIAEALDSDYGWFVPPAPGKAEAVAASLSRSDSKLARLIFSPALYPIVGGAPAPAPEAIRPVPQMPPPPAESQKPPDTSLAVPVPAVPGEQPAPPPASAQAAPVQPEIPMAVVVPPPRSFTLRVERPLPSRAGATRETLDSKSPRGSPLSVRAGPPFPPGSPLREARASSSTPPSRNPIPPPESANPPASRNSPFRIQVSSMRVRASAEAEAGKLARNDLATVIEEVDLGPKGVWYRVYLTGFQSRTEAIKAARKLRAEGLIQDFLPVP